MNAEREELEIPGTSNGADEKVDGGNSKGENRILEGDSNNDVEKDCEGDGIVDCKKADDGKCVSDTSRGSMVESLNNKGEAGTLNGKPGIEREGVGGGRWSAGVE